MFSRNDTKTDGLSMASQSKVELKTVWAVMFSRNDTKTDGLSMASQSKVELKTVWADVHMLSRA